jgi:hypothetical protein
MTARALQLVTLSAALLGVPACYAPLPIDGASCPCPAGYCCVDGTCVPHSECGAGAGGDDGHDGGPTRDGPETSASDAAGDGADTADSHTGGDATDGADSAADGGSNTVTTRIAVGDEVVVGFVPSGTALLTLASATDRSSNGELIIHHLDTNQEEVSGAVVARYDIQIANQRDALIAGNLVWTSEAAFFTTFDARRISPDGRFFAAVDPPKPGFPPALSIFALQPFDNDPVAAVNLAGSLLDLAFNPDGTFLFVTDDMDATGRSIVKRIATTSSIDQVQTAAVSDWPFQFDSAGDAFWWNDPTGDVFRWGAGETQPTVIATLEAGDEFDAVDGDDLYVRTDSSPSTGLAKISTRTGQRETVWDGPASYIASSPDGSHELWIAGGGPAVVDMATKRVVAPLVPCTDPTSEGYAYRLAFSPDSGFVVGNWSACGSGPTEVTDLVSIDVRTDAVRTLATQWLGWQLYFMEGDRVIFVRPLNQDFDTTTDPARAIGDLMVAYLDGRPTELLVPGVDEYIAVSGRTIAYSLHQGADRGVFTVTLPPLGFAAPCNPDFKGVETCANPGVDDDCDGTIDDVRSVPCDIGNGRGACAGGGSTSCSGAATLCTPGDPGIPDGDSSWHEAPAPNGSWDWDCDGNLTKEFPDQDTTSINCNGLDATACKNQGQAVFAVTPLACGQTGDFNFYECVWQDGPTPGCVTSTGEPGQAQQRCR